MRLRILLALVAGALGAPAAAQQAVDHKIPPGYEPEHGPDEAGLWMEVAEYEKAIRQSALLVADPDINNYVDAVVCRVAGPYCADIRVYVIRNPGFNASMTPNGVMQVWTGLLLRTSTTDEMASVIGHEIAHYTRLHTLERLRALKKGMTAGSLFDLGIAVLTGIAVPVGQMSAMLNVLAYNREQESEADFLGTRLLAGAGYDPHASYRVWHNVIAEEQRAVASRREPGIFAQTHPEAESRAAALEAWVYETWGPPVDGAVTRDEHIDLLNSHYLLLMEDQLVTHRYGRTEELLERHARMGIDEGLIDYFYGEMYRQRGEQGDEALAMRAYLDAIESGSAPPEAWKSLGYLYLKEGRTEQAREQFRRYLELAPDASDRAMIEFYLEDAP